ncbi:MAG: leucine-rich repeat protein [Acutalibacteraceae bacterium]|nr:leucine-rich repeat protein [Acutalibacteraceae bacterium]
MKRTGFTRFLSVFLSVLMVSSVVFSSNAFAVVSVSDFEIRNTDIDTPYISLSNVREITGFKDGVNTEDMRTLDFSVTEEVSGIYGCAIGDNAFKGNTYIEDVILWNSHNVHPDEVNILRIGEGAFENCTALKSVDFLVSHRYNFMSGYDMVSEIGSRAFKGCTSLNEFVVPFNVSCIASETFADCTALERIIIFEQTTDIADDAFNGCENLTIYGVKNTAAHSYAIKHNIPFVEIPEHSDTISHNLYFKISSMTYLLNEFYCTYPSIEEPEYDYYAFQDKWGAELRESFNKSVVAYENVFLTRKELATAVAEAEAALHRVNVIEEIYRLDNPEYMHHSSYAHCEACMRASYLLRDYNPFYTGDFTDSTYNYYLKCTTEACNAVESGTATTERLETLLDKLKYSITGLVFQADEDLAEYVNYIESSDLSIYTDDTANKLKFMVDGAKLTVGTSYMYYDDSFFISEITSIGMAVGELRLKTLDPLIEKVWQYQTVCYDDYYKYTDDSIRALSTEICYGEALYNNYSPDIISGQYGEVSLLPLEMYNDDVITQMDKLDYLYENLELLPLGDLDRNGRKDVSDVIDMLNCVILPYEMDYRDKYFADINGDGNVTVLDVVLLQREILEAE